MYREVRAVADKHVEGHGAHGSVFAFGVMQAGRDLQRHTLCRFSLRKASEKGIHSGGIAKRIVAAGADGTQEILIGKTNRSVSLGELDGVTDGSGYTALEGGSVASVTTSSRSPQASAIAFCSFVASSFSSPVPFSGYRFRIIALGWTAGVLGSVAQLHHEGIERLLCVCRNRARERGYR